MALFRFLWLRRLIRKHTTPIPLRKAANWQQRLSLAYMILGWNAVAIIAYQFYQGKGDWAHYHGVKSDEEVSMSPATQFGIQLGVDKARIVRIDGFRKVDERDFVLEEYLNNKDAEQAKLKAQNSTESEQSDEKEV